MNAFFGSFVCGILFGSFSTADASERFFSLFAAGASATPTPPSSFSWPSAPTRVDFDFDFDVFRLCHGYFPAFVFLTAAGAGRVDVFRSVASVASQYRDVTDSLKKRPNPKARRRQKAARLAKAKAYS